MVYGKHIVSDYKFKSPWGPTLYTNAIASLPMFGIAVFTQEYSKLLNTSYSLRDISILLTSCALGVLISFSAFWARSVLTATSFTILGVVNKVLTIALAALLLNDTTNLIALSSLFLCILGGYLYEPSKVRQKSEHNHEQRHQAFHIYVCIAVVVGTLYGIRSYDFEESVYISNRMPKMRSNHTPSHRSWKPMPLHNHLRLINNNTQLHRSWKPMSIRNHSRLRNHSTEYL